MGLGWSRLGLQGRDPDPRVLVVKMNRVKVKVRIRVRVGARVGARVGVGVGVKVRDYR